MAVLPTFLGIFCQLYFYLSWNWDSDGHFEVLNESWSFFGIKVMTQNAQKQKDANNAKELFFTKSQNNRNESMCILSHNSQTK